ncbi:hypothetical protein [Kocuria sp.]|uniref:hypothetical protein n=1 Tax=Kocuria sp. TaxID=1871328 RepID=UPI0026DFAC28|nr:hypothetical protein [Kocuria sp.]MDO5619577.1 hypothetical protein [Kocuria sp.]
MPEHTASRAQKAPDQSQSQTCSTVLAQLPGTDMMETITVLRGELGSPHRAVLPILADRSDTAGTVPRSVAVLTDLWCDLQPHGWRLTRHQGKESRAAASLLTSDINALADVVGAEQDGDRGAVTVEITGPMSLAAQLSLHNGERVLQDHGARRDIAEAMADGVVPLIRGLTHSVGGRQVVLRLAEPLVHRVAFGQIPTASGYRTLRAVARPEINQALRLVADAARAVGAAVELVLPRGEDPRDFGPELADTVFRNRPGPDPRDWEPVAALVERGQGAGLLLPELVDGQRSESGTPRESRTGDLARSIIRPWQDLGLSTGLLDRVTVAPGRGLQHSSPDGVRHALKISTDLAHALHQTALEA